MVIASGVIDRGHLSSFGGPPPDSSSSSFFSEDLVPTERQVGFWKSESMVDQRGSKPAFASPLEKIHPMGANPEGGLEQTGGQVFKGLDALRVSKAMGQGNASTSPSASWGDMLTTPGSRFGLSAREAAIAETASGNSRIMATGVCGQSADALSFICEGDEALGSMEEVEAQTIGDLLPTDDDLISGVIDGFELSGLSINQDDADEDIFGTGGGMELENDDSISVKGARNLEGSSKCHFPGEHHINKCPSRTLFVTNINTNVLDSDLRVLFQQYGDVHKLYTCKEHGYVTVSYYDIRSAQNAMRALHGKPLGLVKLDVQFCIPKGNASDKDMSKGILVVSNIDPSVSNDDLLQALTVYGDVKEICRASTSCNKKLVEFYDVRAAEAALYDLNKGAISGPKIKAEVSNPGGYPREWKLDGSPRQPGGPKSHENSNLHNLFSPVSPQLDRSPHGIASSGPQKLSSPIRIEPTRQYNNQAAIGELGGSLGQGNFGQGMQMFHPHSLPESQNGICNISKSMTSSGRSAGFRVDGVDYSHLQKVGSGSLHGHSAFGPAGVGSFPLNGHHYSWNNSNAFPQSPSSPMLWSNVQHPGPMHGYPGVVPPHSLNNGAYPMDQHHMGSAPNNGGSFRNARSVHPGSLGSVGFPGSPQMYASDVPVFAPARGSYRETMFSPVGAGFPSLQQMCNAMSRRNPMVQVSASYDATNDRMRSRRHDGNAVQPENKRLFELDIERIAKGEDPRTTLMIKNIPNKYNCFWASLMRITVEPMISSTFRSAFINMTDPQHIIPFYKRRLMARDGKNSIAKRWQRSRMLESRAGMNWFLIFGILA
ncbi:unnamed protein product [Triticum turgidum subsp. durum]|uniref:RRM domain-containing protein n=1 Tax=Triticum turgidum subsp. durum TaxID=4567 RepID=A0A9R0QK75_TRITD|nr:unnamed protein product [Triticum turgidum subsp. durum]